MRVLLHHVLPNALNPIISVLGLQVGHLIAGSIVTETIFAWPGVGRLMIGSIYQRDVPIVCRGCGGGEPGDHADQPCWWTSCRRCSIRGSGYERRDDTRTGIAGPQRSSIIGGLAGLAASCCMALHSPTSSRPTILIQQNLRMRLTPADVGRGRLLRASARHRQFRPRPAEPADLWLAAFVMVGIAAMLLAASIGTLLGLMAGWRGGRVEAADHAPRRRIAGHPRDPAGDPCRGSDRRQRAQPGASYSASPAGWCMRASCSG